jgi:D-alanyl-lipoteichoic acid acyltransferase DltB (MBOAT superfamily)
VFNKSVKQQNILLLIASLFFYGYADWRFLFLLCISSLLNFFIGMKIYRTQKDVNKKRFLWLALVINIGVLGYYKYFNFFFESFAAFFNLFGANLHYSPLHILLPLGISFFTFQMLGYIIDIYWEEIEPCDNLLNFSTYVVYFPKLLAGPIERAQKFLPQIEVRRDFNYSLAAAGMRQILWGLFAKLVIANNCAIYANFIFGDHQNANGSTLLIGIFFYAFEIYGDFSGYSNIAIGVSKLFGINLMTNFSTPFFSTNISDFWKKWHISLTTWMMDYVNTPLSFQLRGFKKAGMLISIICTFLLVGLWHGADIKYLLYGLLHGLYFVPLLLFNTSKRTSVVAKGNLFPSLLEAFQMLGLFIVVSFTLVFFRAESISDAMSYLKGIFANNIFSIPFFPFRGMALVTLMLVLIFIFIEWFGRENPYPMANLDEKYPKFKRWLIYYILAMVIFVFSGINQQFIYFQF